MKKYLLFCLSVLSFFVGNAQENQTNLFDGINLNTYKLTDYRYFSLGTGLNAKNDNAFRNYEQRDDNFKSNGHFNQKQISSQGSLNLLSIVNNRKYLGRQEITFGFSSYHNTGLYKSSYEYLSTNEDYSTDNLSNFTNVSFIMSSNNRFYLIGEFFCGVNLNTNQGPSFNYSKNNNNGSKMMNTINNFESQNEIELQMGHGRIENVTDARFAVYILDDLQKQGRLSRTPNQEEVFAFADFLTRTLNKRRIDSRIKRIKEYTAIDSFLVQNGLTTKTDGLYFGIINDNRNYARTQTWNTGAEWHLGVSPLINYTKRFTKTTTDSSISKTSDQLTEYGLGFNAEYRSLWISGLKWQQFYSFRGSFDIWKYDTEGTYFVANNYKIITGNASYQVSYLPNTRTSISGQCGIDVYKYLYEDYTDRLTLFPYIWGSCDYYFSEKLRFQVNASLRYGYDKRYDPSMNQDRWDFTIGIGLQYYFY